MELAIKYRGSLSRSNTEPRVQRQGIDLAKSLYADRARRAKAQQEFLVRRRNLTNPMVNLCYP
jgi:hypothetical protein